MSNVHFISDLHWGHNNICKYRPEFSSEEEHRLTVKENIMSVVKKRDTLWILGDSVFTEECLPDLMDIKCTKFLVLGNHCAQHFDRRLLHAAVDKVFGLASKYGCWLSHAPIHPDELRGKFNLHGHTHYHIIQRPEMSEFSIIGEEDDPRYINMCLEHHNWGPRDLRWVRAEMERRKGLI